MCDCPKLTEDDVRRIASEVMLATLTATTTRQRYSDGAADLKDGRPVVYAAGEAEHRKHVHIPRAARA